MPDLSFDLAYRTHRLADIEKEVWDLIVIGGGITGAAVARDAALRGLRTLLLEADDFASGTSSGSSKLLHGGVRYLEQFEFKLVRDAIHERELLTKLYAPLISDLKFVFPTYSDRFPPRWQLNLGLHLYDAFSGFRVRHENLNISQTMTRFPQLKEHQLTGSCVYTDSFAEDFRLVIELIKAAQQSEAVCLSRMKVSHLETSQELCKIQAVDQLHPTKNYSLRSQYVMNCAGPYSDQIRKLLNLEQALELTQGVHFITKRDRLPISSAFVMADPKLHRILFAIPWKSMTYFGTTDTPIADPSQARATAEDFEYCLRILNEHFRGSLTRKDIIQSWAAVRPLIKPKSSMAPSAISREHHIEESPNRVFHILGGKLTSHRLMAKEALDHLSNYREMPNCTTHLRPLIRSSDHLDLRQLAEQVEYSIRYEMALTPLDFIRRRSALYYESPTLETARAVTSLFEKLASWNQGTTEVEAAFNWDQAGY